MSHANVDHQWQCVTLKDGRTVEVSRDALKVDGVRINVSGAQADKWANELGAELPTPEVLDARWEQAWIQNRPHTQRLWEGENDGPKHSRLVEADVAAATGPPGIVGNVGKHWVKPTRRGPRELYGWHIPRGANWGLPAHASESGETNARIVQRSWDTSHGSSHVDYSMTLVLMREVGAGVPDTDPSPVSLPEVVATEDIYADLDDEPVIISSSLPPPPESDSEQWSLIEIVDEYIEAVNYTQSVRSLESLLWIVLHSTENPIVKGIARAVASFFKKKSSGVSAHYVSDRDEVIQCVPLARTAWAAPSANRRGIQVEICGQALQTDWLKKGTGPTSGYESMVWAARLTAALGRELTHIPMQRVTPSEMVARVPGIVTHDTVRRAIAYAKKHGHKEAPWYRADKGRWSKTSHSDPGGKGDARWPWDEFMTLVHAN